MFGLGPMEIMLILIVALIFIGPQKLPEIAKTLGKSMRDLQRSANDFQREVVSDIERDEKKPEPIVVPKPAPAAGQEAFGEVPVEAAAENPAPTLAPGAPPEAGADADPYKKAAQEEAALPPQPAEPAPTPDPPTTKA